MNKITYIIITLLLLNISTLAQAATLTGTIYDLNLNPVKNTFIEINTAPKQQYLARSGNYSFEVPEGTYTLTARSTNLSTKEVIKVKGKGAFIFDLFLFPSLEEEDTIFKEAGGLQVETDEKKGFAKYPLWSYLVALGIFLFLIGRIVLARKKYPRGKKKEETAKKQESTKEEQTQQEPEKEPQQGQSSSPRSSIIKGEKQTPHTQADSPPSSIINKEEENKNNEKETKEQTTPKESTAEPDYLNQTLDIIKKHQNRITQKELRKEFIHLSEAKVSLIVTELEHKGKIEKIKKGRGNVIILKENI